MAVTTKIEWLAVMWYEGAADSLMYIGAKATFAFL